MLSTASVISAANTQVYPPTHPPLFREELLMKSYMCLGRYARLRAIVAGAYGVIGTTFWFVLRESLSDSQLSELQRCALSKPSAWGGSTLNSDSSACVRFVVHTHSLSYAYLATTKAAATSLLSLILAVALWLSSFLLFSPPSPLSPSKHVIRLSLSSSASRSGAVGAARWAR